MGVATAIAAGAVVAGTIAASNAQKAASQAAENAASQTQAAFANIPVPSIQQQQVILQNPSLAGNYTPEQVQAMQQNVNAMSGVSADQGTINSQNQALQGLSTVAQGGYNQGDLAAIRQSEADVNSQNQARQNSILNAMASRGTLDSGSALAAQLVGNQQADQTMGSNTNNILQQAQARSLSALQQQGSLASNMRSQQFGEGAQKAAAQNQINQFNTQNAQNVANTNAQNTNNASLYNLQQQQNLNNLSAANANAQSEYNSGLYQTNYTNQLAKAQGESTGNAQVASAAQQAGNTQANLYAGVAGGLGNIALGTAAASNKTPTATTPTTATS